MSTLQYNSDGWSILIICFIGDVQLDDALLEQQRAAYVVQGVDESEPAQAGKKRKKQVYTNGEDVSDCESGFKLP